MPDLRMVEMVEIVARAMYEATHHGKFADLPDDDWDKERMLDYASAAIEAMREPPLYAVHAAVDALYKLGPEPSPQQRFKVGLNTMIDAALEGSMMALSHRDLKQMSGYKNPSEPSKRCALCRWSFCSVYMQCKRHGTRNLFRVAGKGGCDRWAPRVKEEGER
jgi:hypothetical protein